MGLQIQFADRTVAPPKETRRFQLQEDPAEPGVWVVPEVLLSPIRELPLLTRIEVKVTGTPEATAARVQSAFFSKSFDPPEQLAERRSLGSGRVRNAGVLPAQAQCEMQVAVRYFNADSRGRPSGPERQELLTCLLFSGAARELAPELTLRNRELQMLPGEPVPVVAEVQNARGASPILSMQYPDTLLAPDDPALQRLLPVVPDLRKALEAALAPSPLRDEAGGVTVYKWVLNLRLPQQARGLVGDLKGVAVPMVASLPGARPVLWQLKVEAPTKVFPGWVVIDFGTTNSTVTVYDTWDYAPPEGLPDEQRAVLQRALSDMLSKSGAVDAFGPAGRGYDADWGRLRAHTASALALPSADAIAEWMRGDPRRLYQALTQLESNLRLSPEPFRRVAFPALHALYREALLVPPLRQFRLFPIELDPNVPVEKRTSVASDIEILGVKKQHGDSWPDIRMGSGAQKARLEALGRPDQGSIEAVMQRFRPSPKRYFGVERAPFVVELEGKQELVTVDQLMRAGWQKLLEFAERAKREEPRFSDGPLRKAVITYPTVAPPSVRQTIQKLLRDLKIADVRTDYDEAVSSAIFYFMREYSAYPQLGLESFKARARHLGPEGWVQNVLVFDIGGGTTDLALIRLTLTEEPVFGPDEERGAAGRYYKITPKLLSSSGHMQLGGELMTLRVFRLLKAMIADRLLALVQEGRLACEPIKAVLEAELPESATHEGRYKNGWIRETIESWEADNNTPRLREALKIADRVLPTSWAEAGEARAPRLQAFYTLWDFSEKAKIHLGSKSGDGLETAHREYRLGADQLSALLDTAYPSYQAKDPKKDLLVVLSAEKMEKAIGKVVDEAVKIAQGTLERLPEGERVDWLILSGQSCNLSLVDRTIREAFGKSKKFVWNPDRVTFLPGYAKLSTSIGACYAENQRRNTFTPQGSKDPARRGINILRFDVNNLFSFLPCFFVIQLEGGRRIVFEAGTELFDLQGTDNEEIQCGQARSKWMEGIALNIDILREDYKEGQQRKWGNFDGQAMARQLELNENQFKENVRLQFEIDHRLSVDVLLRRAGRRNDEPFYQFSGNFMALPLADELPRAVARQAAAPGGPVVPPLPGSGPALFDAEKALLWTIALGSDTPPGETRAPRRVVFEAGQKMKTMAHDPATGAKLEVMLSTQCAEPDDFRAEEGHLVYVWAQPAAGGKWVPLGRIERPGKDPIFRRYYRLTLDEKGVLRLHSGEPPYWESADPQCLVNEPGRVYRRALEPTKRETDEDRDPFTGKH